MDRRYWLDKMSVSVEKSRIPGRQTDDIFFLQYGIDLFLLEYNVIDSSDVPPDQNYALTHISRIHNNTNINLRTFCQMSDEYMMLPCCSFVYA